MAYEVADDLAGKWIMCRGCQKRGPVRSLSAKGNADAAGAASIALASANPSRRQALRIGVGVLASLASITTGALLARYRPWRNWGDSDDSSPETTRRRGRGRGPGGPPGP